MTTIAEHGATVLPITVKQRTPRGGKAQQHRERTDGPLPDNVIVLARFARHARAAHGRHWLGGPPEGEAA
jgi:hypothetical protein